MRYLFTVQYLGTRYAGWQSQKNAIGIQQIVEGALSTMCKERVRVEGAGRTDSGVHALAQRAHADVPHGISPKGLLLGLNNLLPADIRIMDAQPVSPKFHSRFDAVGKTYLYQIWTGSVADVFHSETHAHVSRPLSLSAMTSAGESLAGSHDFRAFTVRVPEVSSTSRTISNLEISGDAVRVTIRITANGFLRFMVRRIAGLLIEMGLENLSASETPEFLEPGFREVRWAAPAKGLTLVNVAYPELPEG